MTICKQRFLPVLRPSTALLAALCAGVMLVLSLLPAMQVPALARGGGERLLSALAPDAYASAPLVAHAMGQIGDHTGTNSLEAFQNSYAAGYRLFECDLAMTSDGKVVLRHDWSAGLQEGVDPEHIPTAEEFQARPIYGQYTPLTFADLLGLLAVYPDVYFILDGKDTDAGSVTKQYTAIDELTPQLLRLFIQRIEIGERTKKHSRSAGQSVRIVYRDIGALDTPMREGDHAPHMTKEITEKERIIRLLA